MKIKLGLAARQKIAELGGNVAFLGTISLTAIGIVDGFYEKSVSAAKAVTFLAGQIQSGSGEFTMLAKDLLRVTDDTNMIYSLKDHARQAADVIVNNIIPGTGGQTGYMPTWSEKAMEYMLKMNNIDVTNTVGFEHSLYFFAGAAVCAGAGALVYKIARRY